MVSVSTVVTLPLEIRVRKHLAYLRWQESALQWSKWFHGHAEHHDAQRPDVNERRPDVPAAVEHLGRHVIECSCNRPVVPGGHLGGTAAVDGKAKVAEFRNRGVKAVTGRPG